MEKLNKYSTLILLLGGIIATAVSITVFAYTNFQTKESAKDQVEWLDKRLDRIETKIDNIKGE